MSKTDVSKTIYNQTNPTSDSYSEKVGLAQGSMLSVHIVYGGLTGTLTLWASNIEDPSEADDTDWVQNTDVTFTAMAGAGKQLVNAGNAAAKWYRVKYAHSSGTGDLDMYYNAGEA